MPRSKNHGSTEPKRRSRNGCWPCKSRKVKCGEEHPSCQNCLRTGDTCDYRIRLNWEGRRIKRRNQADPDSDEALASPVLLSNEYLERGVATPDNIGVPLQRYATEPTPTSVNPIQYEFEHTLFQDLHREPQESFQNTTRKKKAKSMCDSESLDQRQTDHPAGPIRGWQANNATPQSPTSTTSTSEGTFASSSHQTEPSADLFYGEHAQSPENLHRPRLWNPGATFDDLAGESPHLSKEAYCISDEMIYESIWVDFLAAETSDRNSSAEDAGDELVECPSSIADMGQVGQGCDIVRSMTWPNGEEYWKSEPIFACETLADRNSVASAEDDGLGGYQNSELWMAQIGRQRAMDLSLTTINPVPDKLKDQTNLMFFDHFMNYTAKVMAPYLSKQGNPFTTLLPAMAFRSDIVLSLLLAFAAAHRGQVLRAKEPELRIAEWANDIFPRLRSYLDDETKAVPDEILVSMVLLTALDKSSPDAFGHSIPWQKHLSLTRGLMGKRLGDLYVYDKTDEQFSFIWSWFSYLDTMGQISMGEHIGGNPYQTGPFDLTAKVTVEDEDEFDCTMGFTARCGRLLVELASQVRHSRPGTSEPRTAAEPTIEEDALKLEHRFRDSMKRPVKVCRHIEKSKVDMRDLTEMDSASEAFHLAGIVCLRRRVLGKPSTDEDIQNAVQQIWECIQHIRRDREADTACVFPLFIAGCETIDFAQRKLILARFKSAEKSGMRQVKRARKLMEASWRSGISWHDLVQGEFLG